MVPKLCTSLPLRLAGDHPIVLNVGRACHDEPAAACFRRLNRVAWPLLYERLVTSRSSGSSAINFNATSTPGNSEALRLTVILCTYNRATLLDGAVTSVLGQTYAATPSFELVVVDNNSTDATRAVVARLAAQDPRLRYVFEPRQGLSHARNAGILHARGDLIAFIDDDLRADPDWVAAIVRAFDEHPDIDVVGGRVLPRWPSPPPTWLTQDHWAPLALADHGDRPFVVTAERPICLIGAGACRRTVFDAVGTFVTDFQRVKDSVGSLEDHDFIVRVLGTGRRGLYAPGIVVRAAVQPDRLEPAYHRRWHRGHGHFHALLRSELIERTSIGSLFGVPGHLYRQALHDLAGWARAAATGASATAFLHEVRLRFFTGFFRTRFRDYWRRPRRERRRELLRTLRGVFRRRPQAAPSVKGAS